MKRILPIVIFGIALIGVIITFVFLGKNKKFQEKDVTQSPLITQAENYAGEGKLLEAQGIYKKALEENNDGQNLQEIQNRIDDLNVKIIFSPKIDRYSIRYIVKPNDSLAKIAKQHKTTINLIKRSNGLSSDVIHPGQILKVNNCVFSIVVDKSQNRLFLKVGEEIIKTYIVSTGKNNSSPVGTFKITNKLMNPTWFKAGAVIPASSPENILGTRWLGFDLKGYGIHGTTEPERLGEQVTLGCVRMKNQEVEDIYDLIPEGTEVVIVD